MDVQEQLAELRRKIARDRSQVCAAPAAAAACSESASRALRPARYFVEELISGEVVATAAGEHFETEKLYERHRRHGSIDISDLIELPEDLLDSLSGGTILRSHPKRWAFLDTETTGLAGGAGTYAFLIGVGSIDEEGFRVRQFFMRDYGDEPSLLAGLERLPGPLRRADHLQRQDLRSAAARNPLPHGARAAAVRPHGASRSAASARAACGSCASTVAGWWTWRIRSWASSARAICRGR